MFQFPQAQTRRWKPPRQRLPSTRQELIVLAADLSASMQQPFRLPGSRQVSRLAALQEAIDLYLTQKAAESQHTQVAVVGFGLFACLLCDWTPLGRLPGILATVRGLRRWSVYELGGCAQPGAKPYWQLPVALRCSAARQGPARHRRRRKRGHRNV